MKELKPGQLCTIKHKSNKHTQNFILRCSKQVERVQLQQWNKWVAVQPYGKQKFLSNHGCKLCRMHNGRYLCADVMSTAKCFLLFGAFKYPIIVDSKIIKTK